jgi:CHRD domain
MKHLFAAVTLAAAAAASQAAPITFYATLSPEVAGATGSGNAVFTYDTVTHDLRVVFNFSGLSGITTVAHIHCCTAVRSTGTAGVAVTPGTLPGFLTGVSSGSYDALIDLDLQASFTNAFLGVGAGVVATTAQIDAARDRLVNAFQSRTAYLNVHSNAFPGGEIRGFVVPEPATWALALGGLLAAGLVKRQRAA